MISKKPTRSIPPSSDDTDATPGFTIYKPEFFDYDTCEPVTRIQLLVPSNRYEEIVLNYVTKKKEWQTLQDELRTRKQQLQEKAYAELSAKRDREDASKDQAAGKDRPHAPKKLDFNSPPVRLRPAAALDYCSASQYPVFASDAPMVMHSRALSAAGDKDTKKRDLELSHRLTERGVLRKVAAPEGVDALDPLYASYPSFREVIDLVRGQMLLAMKSGAAPRIPPILLDGEPGLGKTHFASALAKVLGAPVQNIAFDSSLTAARLIGSDRHWANTCVGALFESICLGTHANPVFVLDEIDKATGRNYQDPVAALHSLLEPSTSCRVKDSSADMEFDASLVTWIATSNQARLLPDSLRSRFREFHITRPSAEESITVARMMVESILEELNLDDFIMPDRAFCVTLAHLVPREVQQAVQQAVACAVAGGRTRVRLDDIPARFRDDDNKPKEGSPWLH